jgi:hypothetical protein
MSKLFALIFSLIAVFLMTGTLAYAGQAPLGVVVSPTHVEKVPSSQTKVAKWYEKAKQAIVSPFQTKEGSLNILGFIIGLIIPFATAWKLFTKAGIEGWWCLIPIGNTIMYLKMVGQPWTKIFLLLIPFYNIYLAIKWNLDLAEKFGKPRAFGWGITFLSPIFLGILAWDKSVSYK